MKQTAVEYLFQQIWDTPKDKLTWHSLLEQAKEMEKEQIVDAYNNGDNRSADLYYTSTYGSQNITLQNNPQSKVITELSDEEIKPTHKVGKFIIEAIKEKIARTSQTELSDEEIEKAVNNPMHDAYDFREGAKWYREQLKKR